MSHYKSLLKKIDDKSIVVGVIGLGYVGLPLAVTFARNGISVLGFEKSTKKTELVNAGPGRRSESTVNFPTDQI